MSKALVEPVRTPSLTSRQGAEPLQDAGVSQLPGHRPATTATERTSDQDASNYAASLAEAGGDCEKPQSFRLRLRRALQLHKHPSSESARYSYKCELDQIIPTLDQHPVGYGKLAAFESCDPDFRIYRKFDWLRNNALLYLQDELVELEEDLEALNSYDFTEKPIRLVSRRQNDGPDGLERRELLKKIREKLAEYDESIIRLQKIQAMRRPTTRNQKSLANFIFNTGSQAAEESDWIRIGNDLIAVAHDQEHGWLIGFLEYILLKISRTAAIAIFRTHEQKVVTGEEPITLLSAARLDILLRSVLTVCASILLLTPVFILFKIQPRNRADVERNTYFQILVIFVFTIAFSALCSLFTKAKRQEVFAATAAYCAVLVVFLGNTSSLTMSSPA